MAQKKVKKNSPFFHIDAFSIKIVPFADWHIGSEACDLRLVRKAISQVAKDKNCYAIIVGDLMETVTCHSKGLIFKQKLTGTEQYKALKELLWPIRNKILYAVTGNHEKRVVKETSTDIMEVFCNDIGITYCGFEKHFILRLKDRIIRCYMHHNTGGGTTHGAKINRLVALHFRAPMADIIFSGHTHDLSDAQKVLTYQTRTGAVKTKIQHFISCGSALRSDVGYACENAYPPVPVGFKAVHIHYCKNKDIPDINIQIHQ